MRQVFLVTTALVAAGLLVQQARGADPIRLTLGGFYAAATGVEIGGEHGTGDPGESRQAGSFKQNVEAYFKGSTTLDNGLTAGAHVELEGNNTAGRVIDEVWSYFKGGFGEFRFGDTYGAIGKSCIVDPGEITNNFGLVSPNNSFTNVANRGTGAAIYLGALGPCEESGKVARAVYFSPTFGDFHFALSYAPRLSKTAGPQTGTNENSGNRHAVGGYLTYIHDFGTFNVTAGAGVDYIFESALDSSDKPAFYQAGLQVGFGRLTVGGSFEYFQNYAATLADASAPVATDSDAWDATIGASYAVDAWTIGLEGNYGRFNVTSSSDTDTYYAISLQGTYKLSPGIVLEGEVAWFHYHDAHGEPNPTPGGTPSGPTLHGTDGSVSVGIGSYMTF
jgi:hypothetical protein